MIIVETLEEYKGFIELFRLRDSLVIPVFSDHREHPAANRLCLVYVWFESGDTYILPFDHNETVNLPPEYLAGMTTIGEGVAYTPFKKALTHSAPALGGSTKDYRFLEYMMTGTFVEEEKFFTRFQRHMYGLYGHQSPQSNVTRAVPLFQLLGYCEAFLGHLKQFWQDRAYLEADSGFHFHNDIVLPALQFMEAGGIKVNEEKFVARFGERNRHLVHDGLVYTEYNPFTAAGRVTSRFGGVNYAALDKKDGTREAFESRFPGGLLVMMDFESFHPRIIAELIGFELPKEPAHEYFAKQYFGPDYTKEQYDLGKQLTFKFLYSTRREGNDFPFFRAVYDWIDKMYKDVALRGGYESKTGRMLSLRHIENPNPAKMFNYILQLRETEITMESIYYLIRLYREMNSKVVLYTYDSLVIDFDPTEGKDILKHTIRVLENDGRFPVRVYVGHNYQSLYNMTDVAKR
jgi:hypothetical protein